MSKNIECETRVMLNEEQYNKMYRYVIDYLDNKKIINTNHYFDNNKLETLKKHIVIRKRNINNVKFEVTTKCKREGGDIEINEPLNYHEFIDLSISENIKNTEIEKILEKYKINSYDLKEIVSLKTYRLEANFDDSLLVLDLNEYNNITDYNLEVEADSMEKSKSTMEKLCDMFNITFQKHYLSKSRRAMLSLML